MRCGRPIRAHPKWRHRIVQSDISRMNYFAWYTFFFFFLNFLNNNKKEKNRIKIFKETRVGAEIIRRSEMRRWRAKTADPHASPLPQCTWKGALGGVLCRRYEFYSTRVVLSPGQRCVPQSRSHVISLWMFQNLHTQKYINTFFLLSSLAHMFSRFFFFFSTYCTKRNKKFAICLSHSIALWFVFLFSTYLFI